MKNSKLVGYGGLVHIEWDHLRAEVSFLVDTEISGTKEDYSKLFPSFLNLIKDEITESSNETKVGGEKQKLVPTDIGNIVNKFMIEHFSNIIDYSAQNCLGLIIHYLLLMFTTI